MSLLPTTCLLEQALAREAVLKSVILFSEQYNKSIFKLIFHYTNKLKINMCRYHNPIVYSIIIKIRYSLTILFSFIYTASAVSQDTLRFSTIEGSIHMDIGFEILNKAYNEIGYEITKSTMPGKISLESSDAGKFDGELLRIDGITKDYPHLIQIPIPVTFFQAVTFSTKYYFPVNSWYSLEPYHIGIVKGALYAEFGTQGMNVFKANSVEDLFKKLKNQEIDVAVTSKLIGQIHSIDFPEMKGLEGILETMFLYHYVHEKNVHLIPELEKVLKRMLLDGTSRRMKVQALRTLKLGRNQNGINRQ